MERMRIVVGVDGSRAAEEALRWTVALGRTLAAEIVAVHAVGLLEDVHDPDDDAGSWRTGLRGLVERSWCAGLRDSGCPYRVVVRDGPRSTSSSPWQATRAPTCWSSAVGESGRTIPR